MLCSCSFFPRRGSLGFLGILLPIIMRARGANTLLICTAHLSFTYVSTKTKKRLLAFTPVPVCNMYLYLLGYTIICWPRDDESRGALTIP